LGEGNGNFGNSTTFPVGNSPESSALGDLDNDGILDLLVTSAGAYAIAIYLGNGDRTFQTPIEAVTNSHPRDAVISDLNNDGISDIAAICEYPKEFSILLGNGDGTFQPPVIIGEDYTAADVDLHDLNNDGFLDIIITVYASGRLIVGLGQGDGTFPVVGFVDTYGGPSHTAIGDLDNDAIPDIALAFDTGVQILRGIGNGMFLEWVYYPNYSYEPLSLAIGDLNRDGIQDLAVGWDTSPSHNRDRLSIRLGNGDGTFQDSVYYDAYARPRSLAIGDMGGDGIPDLVVAASHSILVFPGNGDGTLQAYESYGSGHNHRDVAIVDLDRVGLPDVVVADSSNDKVLVLLNRNEPVEGTIAANLTCIPASGTLPFSTRISVNLHNRYSGQFRRIAARLNITMAAGPSITNWRRGYVAIPAWTNLHVPWYQEIPALGLLLGDNVFTLEAEDVTPAPFNLPPYPPAGDTDVGNCTVTGVAP
jgi:hypothetical protein